MSEPAIRSRQDCNSMLLATVSCAVLAATLGQAAPARAETVDAPEASAGDATNLGEVVVTASRRTETVSKLPFNISAYGGQQL